jgi:hypothetical protein
MSMASSQSEAGNYGNIDFGSRDGGNSWIIILILVAGALLAWAVYKKGGA